MRSLRAFLLVGIVTVSFSCRTARTPGSDDGKIQLTLVQVNDVYEIAPLEGGKSGGMARVATLKQQELQKNPNTMLVMCGDFLSPSVYGSLTYNGKRIRGAQMIDAMNVAGFDLTCFGNHEFDIPFADLQERIDSSKFAWVSSNASRKIVRQYDTLRMPFHNRVTDKVVASYYIRDIVDADGTTAKIGFIGLVLPSNPADYVKYGDPIHSAIEAYNYIRESCDAVVAITHLAITDDRRLAEALPGLAAILGGHEHDMRFEKVNSIYITKAHANAKSAYVVKLDINKIKKEVRAKPKLVYLGEKVALDSATNVTVQKWVKIANDNYASSGFNATAIVPYKGEPLDGREGPVRSSSTNLTTIVTEAMLFAAPMADAAVFNSGSIRVDDILYAPITQYDILRTLPFGGGVRELDIKGSLLIQTLDAGLTNKGSGGWLQYGNIANTASGWHLKGIKIDPNSTYRIVVPDFLITGKETNLGFFNEKNPGVVKMYPAQTSAGQLQSDIRLAVIRYLEQRK
jgi:2',3'-cyclic-nucleotide 2'-phosphodiesterase (5'-nucleotidase family)